MFEREPAAVAAHPPPSADQAGPCCWMKFYKKAIVYNHTSTTCIRHQQPSLGSVLTTFLHWPCSNRGWIWVFGTTPVRPLWPGSHCKVTQCCWLWGQLISLERIVMLSQRCATIRQCCICHKDYVHGGDMSKFFNDLRTALQVLLAGVYIICHVVCLTSLNA